VETGETLRVVRERGGAGYALISGTAGGAGGYVQRLYRCSGAWQTPLLAISARSRMLPALDSPVQQPGLATLSDPTIADFSKRSEPPLPKKAEKGSAIDRQGSLPALSSRHLLGISELDRAEILSIFDVALEMREKYLRTSRKSDLLAGRTVVNLFAESSTRTRSSFELAARRLGADVLNFAAEASSFAKGETLLDTVHNLEAMHVDAVVIRHSSSGVPWYLAERCTSHFINAGDGRHEHPTQGLLDTLTLYERWGGPTARAAGGTGFEGKRVTIVGDILHGRVALSNILVLQKLGAEVAVCGPPTLIPRGIEELGVRVFFRLEEAIEFSHALNMLRIQRERQDRAFFPNIIEYARLFGLTSRKLRHAPDDLLILHPGPINRGIELDGDVADGPRSVIMQQVENGVAVRMAVLGMVVR
jgi:aspartate carbamoyltransferase catalytic subunit